MKRLLALVLTLLLMVALATSCGAGSSATNGAAPGEGKDMYGEMQESTSDSVSGGFAEAPSNAGTTNIPADAKIIYTGDLNLQTTDLDAAVNDLATLVDGFGGYFESQEVYLNRTYKDAYYIVRVPGERFIEFLDSVAQRELYSVTYRNVNSQNVGEQYADIENRLETLNIKLDRLQNLLEQAENMEDIITIEAAITEVEYEIESLSGQKNRYDSLINYSTVNISISEVSVASEGVDPTLGQRISVAFMRGIENFAEGCEDLLVWFVGNWIGLLIFIAVVIAVITFIRRLKGIPKRKKKKLSGQEETKSE